MKKLNYELKIWFQGWFVYRQVYPTWVSARATIEVYATKNNYYRQFIF